MATPIARRAAMLVLGFLLGATMAARPGAAGADPPDPSTGPPPLYEALRSAALEHAGRIRGGTIRIDRFEFSFADGNLFLVAPVLGRRTGAVFLGDGAVRAYPPDAVEHQQIKKHLDADLLDERFTRLVLRFSDDTANRLVALVEPSPAGDLREASALYREQQEDRFKALLTNPDSRILADLLDLDVGAASPPAGYVMALVDGRERGWFGIEVEPREHEAISVTRYDRGHDMTDVWMQTHAITAVDASGQIADPFAGFAVDPASLDKDADEITGADLGLPPRPVEPRRDGRAQFEVPVVTVDLALEGNGNARGTVALLVEPRRDLGAVRFRISPWLHVTDVRWREVAGLGTDGVGAPDASSLDLLSPRSAAAVVGEAEASSPVAVQGEPLHVVQERRTRVMTDDWFEPWVTVALPRKMGPGAAFILEMAYEGKLLEKLRVSGDYLLRDTIYWMPVAPEDQHSRYHLTFRVAERDDVVSSGDLLDERVAGKTHIVRRVVRAPALHASFHYGRFDTTTVDPEGLLPITLYEDRNRLGVSPGIRQKTIEDLAGALRTQRDYFGPYPFDSLHVTETPATSGQAFPGFLLLSFQAFGELYTGEAELFRSHEVAHQWWGAGVHWRDYRDQWLSEGFAQYGAALYVLSGLRNEGQFRDILTAWRHDVVGEVNIGQGNGRHYGFQPAVIRKSQGSASGPLAVGYRLRSTKTPFDYRVLVYEKGAFVLHMLRTMLLDPESGNDDRFKALMRQFASDNMHAMVTNATFEAAVTAAFGESMAWFFDQWVYGVDIPTYRPRLQVAATDAAAGGMPFVLRGTVTQDDVPDGFRMPVPIAIRYADRPTRMHTIWIDRPVVDVSIPLPARPTEVEFNYLNGVLATVR